MTIGPSKGGAPNEIDLNDELAFVVSATASMSMARSNRVLPFQALVAAFEAAGESWSTEELLEAARKDLLTVFESRISGREGI